MVGCVCAVGGWLMTLFKHKNLPRVWHARIRSLFALCIGCRAAHLIFPRDVVRRRRSPASRINSLNYFNSLNLIHWIIIRIRKKDDYENTFGIRNILLLSCRSYVLSVLASAFGSACMIWMEYSSKGDEPHHLGRLFLPAMHFKLLCSTFLHFLKYHQVKQAENPFFF